jgi:FkbM family methyltransferase
MQPESARKCYPDATWVATAIRRPAAAELRAQLRAMGVKVKPLWECLPVCHGLPPSGVLPLLLELAGDNETMDELRDQVQFRRDPNYDTQRPPSDIVDIYFPDFIQHRDDEHFVDCGAADGDTILEFRKRWTGYRAITGFEPDPSNFKRLASLNICDPIEAAVCDRRGTAQFAATGDYSAHLGVGSAEVRCYTLEGVQLDPPPTFIKMDIEGSELEALWGARRTLKEHKPVLAICAYHTSDHLYEIPLLIHAIQPDYKLFLRRYAEGAFELVWYAVPPERIINV